MPDINAQFPIKGINEGEAYGAQPPQTTREAVNVQAADPQNGRSRGVQRAGLSLYNTTQLSNVAKVAELAHVVYDNNKTTWSLQSTELTSAEWQKELPGKGDCKDLALDRQNNVYTTDLTATIVKVNSAGNVVFSLVVPVADEGHQVKSLCVDDSDYIFCGVSNGGDQSTAKLFAYEQLELDKTNRIWDITVGMFAKRMVVKNGLLVVGFDDLRQQRSYVHVYDAIQTGVPLLKSSWETPYPVNDLTFSGKDGGIVTVHEPNQTRGISTASPGSTASSIDWQPTDLPNWSKRAWCWLDATDVDGDGTYNSAYKNGDEVLQWTDKSGNNRNLYQNTDAVNVDLSTDRPPTLLKGVVAGRDAVAFNGINQSMKSGGNSSSVSTATTQSLRGQNLTLWPSEAGAQFAMFVVFRAPQERVIRCLMSQEDGTTHNLQTCRALLMNRNAACRTLMAPAASANQHYAWFGPDDMLGNINWYEQAGRPTGATNQYQAPSGYITGGVPSDDPTGTRITGTLATGNFTAGNYNGQSNVLGFRPAAGSSESDYTIVTVVSNGGDPMVAGAATDNNRYNSQLWVNGRLIDTWTSRPDLKSVFPVYVGWTLAPAAAAAQYRFRGLLCEVLVLSDWYETQNSAFEAPTRKVPCKTEHNDSSLSFPGTGGNLYNGASYFQDAVVSGATWFNHGMERAVIEGYLAHKWGMSHLLPAGKWAYYRAPTGSFATAAGATVVIDDSQSETAASKTYTFRAFTAAFTGTANEVRLGNSATIATGTPVYESLLNLYSAINKTGTAGTSTGTTGAYDESVVAAANCLALPPTLVMTTTNAEPGTGDTTPMIRLALRTKSVVLSEVSSAFSATTWTGAAFTDTVDSGTAQASWLTGNQTGALRHRCRRYHLFYLSRPFLNNYLTADGNSASYGLFAGNTIVASILGGPPRKDGKRLSSPYQAYSAKDGAACKWDASSGRLLWALHSRINGDADAPFGGLGYAVASTSEGTMCFMGPPQDEVKLTVPREPLTNPGDRYKQGGTIANGVTVRTAIDTGGSLTTSTGAWTKFQVSTDFNKPSYSLPRIGVDYWGNFVLPWCSFASQVKHGAFVVTDASTGDVLHKYIGQESDVQYAPCYLTAVAAPANIDYAPGVPSADSRAQYVVLGGRTENYIRVEATGTNPSDGNTILVKLGDNADTQRTYTFRNTLAAVDDVKIGADYNATLTSLAKAINGTGTAGTDYFNGTTAHADVSCKIIYDPVTPTDIDALVISSKSPVLSGQTDATVVVTTASTAFTVGVSQTVSTNLRRVKLVNNNPGTGTTRNFINVGVAGGQIKTFDDVSTVTSVTGGAFSSANSDFYQSAVLFQKVYITNGQQTLVYDPRAGTASELKSTTGGEVPARCKLIASWRARLVLARSSDSPHNWFMSAIGEPTNWDLFPKVINAGQAIAGTISKAGLIPDVINSLVPYNDDLLIIGGDHSIYRLTGDPMAGGQMDLVTDVTGMAFGHSWDKDPQGNLYFVSPRGGLYVMSPGKRGIVEISNSRFEQRLSEIDLTSNYVRVVWNDLERQLHIFVMPYGPGGTHLKHFRWERDNNAFWQDEFGPATGAVNATAVQPTAAIIIDGDAPGDRQLLIGGEDGRVRKWDKDSRKDQITANTSWPIDSQVVMGPYGVADAELRLTMLQGVLASDRQRAGIQIYSSDTPDQMGDMVWSGTLYPGRNPNIFARAKGSYFWIRLRNAWPDETWAFESLTLRVAKAGRKRVRP